MLYYIIPFTIIIWIIIPFRQFRGRYFFYFLFLALMDPLTLFLRIFLNSNSNYFYIPLSYLAFVSLFDFSIIKKARSIFIIIFLIVCISNFSDYMADRFFFYMSLIHIMILLYFIKEFMVSFLKSKIFNVFILLLIFYELTIVTKNLNLIAGFTDAQIYHFISSIFEILIGLFFCFFKTDNRRFILQFK